MSTVAHQPKITDPKLSDPKLSDPKITDPKLSEDEIDNEIDNEIADNESDEIADEVDEIEKDTDTEIVSDGSRLKIFNPEDGEFYDGVAIGPNAALFSAPMKNVQKMLSKPVKMTTSRFDGFMDVRAHYYAEGLSVLVFPYATAAEPAPTLICSDLYQRMAQGSPVVVGDEGSFNVDPSALSFLASQRGSLNFEVIVDHSSVFSEEDFNKMKVFQDGAHKVNEDLFVDNYLAGELYVEKDVYNLNYFCRPQEGPIVDPEYLALLQYHPEMKTSSSVAREFIDKKILDPLEVRTEEIDFEANDSDDSDDLEKLAKESKYGLPIDRQYDLTPKLGAQAIKEDEGANLNYLWFLLLIPVLVALAFFIYKKKSKKPKTEVRTEFDDYEHRAFSSFDVKPMAVDEDVKRPSMQQDLAMIPMKI